MQVRDNVALSRGYYWIRRYHATSEPELAYFTKRMEWKFIDFGTVRPGREPKPDVPYEVLSGPFKYSQFLNP